MDLFGILLISILIMIVWFSQGSYPVLYFTYAQAILVFCLSLVCIYRIFFPLPSVTGSYYIFSVILFSGIALGSFTLQFNFIRDGFGIFTSTVEVNLIGVELETRGSRTKDLFNIQKMEVQNSITKEMYTASLNDPNSKDLKNLFEVVTLDGNRKTISKIVFSEDEIYIPTQKSLKYRITYLRHKKLITSATLLDINTEISKQTDISYNSSTSKKSIQSLDQEGL